jgi:hypothetical protein
MKARDFLTLIANNKERYESKELDIYAFAALIIEEQKEASAKLLEAAGMPEAAELVRQEG